MIQQPVLECIRCVFVAHSFGKKVRNLSNNVDIRKILRFTIRSELISDTNLRNAVSWSEVFKFTFSFERFQ
jgi:hypothetical protein